VFHVSLFVVMSGVSFCSSGCLFAALAFEVFVIFGKSVEGNQVVVDVVLVVVVVCWLVRSGGGRI